MIGIVLYSAGHRAMHGHVRCTEKGEHSFWGSSRVTSRLGSSSSSVVRFRGSASDEIRSLNWWSTWTTCWRHCGLVARRLKLSIDVKVRCYSQTLHGDWHIPPKIAKDV